MVNGGDRLFYSPPNGFIGRDEFTYTVVDSAGNQSSATVVVNVTFQTNVPIAVDDVFQVPAASNDRPLNVLDNDLASVFGGLTITSVTGGSEGGTLSSGWWQSIRYTPLPNFGEPSSSLTVFKTCWLRHTTTVTVNILPSPRTMISSISRLKC